jgi:DNA-damage-inducible protein J
MDEGLKKEFDWLCTELGLNMTTAFNVFARTVVRHRRIPFEIALDHLNAETIEAINEVRQAKQNPNKKLYANFSELLEEVEADV